MPRLFADTGSDPVPELAVVFSRRPNESYPASNYDDASVRSGSENVKGEEVRGFGGPCCRIGWLLVGGKDIVWT